MPRKTDTAEAVKETETQAAAEEVKQENLMYVGPTIPGIGIQNRVYTEIPEAAKKAPGFPYFHGKPGTFGTPDPSKYEPGRVPTKSDVAAFYTELQLGSI